jgi:uncharacterized protein (TIGR02646 family)
VRQINKEEPAYFLKAKSKVKLPKVKSAWEDDNISAIRENLRAEMLLDEQSLLCAYCEKEIDENAKNSNIDHFKTRNLFPEETLNYYNLLISCNTHGRCSYLKDNSIKYRDEYENIVNPIIEDPNDFFDYLTTGEIVAKNEKGQFTIDIFNLDDKSLIECREQIAKALLVVDFSLDEIYAFFPDYHSFIENIYPKLKEL